MPVILFNNTLQFPAIASADTFIYVSLHSVIQKLTSITSLKDSSIHVYVSSSNIESSTCDFEEIKSDSTYYLICGNFAMLNDANHFVQVMFHEGYKDANILTWQKMNRVYIEHSTKKSELVSLFKTISKKYRGSYIMPIPISRNNRHLMALYKK